MILRLLYIYTRPHNHVHYILYIIIITYVCKFKFFASRIIPLIAQRALYNFAEKIESEIVRNDSTTRRREITTCGVQS